MKPVNQKYANKQNAKNLLNRVDSLRKLVRLSKFLAKLTKRQRRKAKIIKNRNEKGS